MKLFSMKLTKKDKIIISVVSAVITLLIVGGIYITSQIKPPDLKPVIDNEEDENSGTAERVGDIYTFLFAGRDKVGLNTDTMMVVSFDTTEYTIDVLNIPRDTMSADVPRSVKKLNAAYGVTGKANAENLVKEVEQIIGIPIDKFAVIKLDVFIEVIDLIGGVEVDVPRRMHYNDPGQDLYIDLKPGLQTLDGEQSMGFVRWRHNNDLSSGYAMGDLGRIETQQIFLEAAAKAVLKPSVITKVPKILETVFENIETDFTIGEIAWLAKEALNVNLETGINMYMLPGVPGDYNGGSYYFANETELLALLNASFNPTNKELTSKDVNLANVPPPKPKPKPKPKPDPKPVAPPVEPPVDPVVPPVDPTDPPVEPPIDPVDPPIDPTDPPVEPPVDPVEPIDPPIEPPVEPEGETGDGAEIHDPVIPPVTDGIDDPADPEA